MGLAKLIDARLNLAWYQRQLSNAQTCDHHESVAQLQCFLLLCKVNPTIALAVDQMPPSVRPPICLYLLLAHCLSATQNDKLMTLDDKSKVFSEFPRYLQDPSNFYGKDSCERELMGEAMWHFDLLVSEFQCIEARFQTIILEGVTRTAEGLVGLLPQPSLKTATEYNLYCHFHGSLHWIVLMKIIAAADHLEYPYLANEVHLCNSAGLLLAKAQAIADFTTAKNQNQSPLPREYWEIYCDGELAELSNPDKGAAAKFFINHMVLDAMRHVPDVFNLLSRLENSLVFRLLAIPQCYEGHTEQEQEQEIDIASLATIHDQDIDLASLATICRNLHGLSDYQSMLHNSLMKVRKNVKLEDPTSGQMMALLGQLEMICSRTRNRSLVLIPWQLSLGVTVELLVLALFGAIISVIVSVR